MPFDLKVPPLNSLQIHPIKHSISDKNPDLLEVYSSKVQAPECFIRSVNAYSTSELFNLSKSTITNTKASILRGSHCKADYSFKNQLNISSPLSVSSEESASALNAFDLKLDSEIEGVGLNALFNDEGFPPNKVPLDLPKDLLTIVNDCGIILA